jgi:hypothetical protein
MGHSPLLILCITEGHRPSAHQAAEPQEIFTDEGQTSPLSHLFQIFLTNLGKDGLSKDLIPGRAREGCLRTLKYDRSFLPVFLPAAHDRLR